MFILITGDPVEGFEYHGPFISHEEAAIYGERHYSDGYWWTTPLENKDNAEEIN
jgi:hypothetical protein